MRTLYAEAVYDDEEISAVVEVLRTQRLSLMSSTQVKNFESRVATLFGNKHGVMVNSGSSANLLAIKSLNLKPGSEVITPCLTFSTTVAPIVQSGLVPNFVDVKKTTFCIDEDLIEKQITANTSAIMVPNLLGNIPDWVRISNIAEKFGLPTIQDSADTIGGNLNDLPLGNFSTISTTSFYASHVVTAAGFGGMLVSDSEDIRDKAKLFRGWGRQSSLMQETEDIDYRFNFKLDGIEYDAKYVFSELGYNFLPSEISAVFGLIQLNKLKKHSEIRARNFGLLANALKDYEDYFELPERYTQSDSPWLAFPFLVKGNAPFRRAELQRFLEQKEIQTRTVFSGNILRQPALRGIKHVGDVNNYPESDYVMRNGLVIGCHHGLKENQIEYILDAIKEFLVGKRISA